MSKRLKLFGLLALTVALGAGVAWAFGTLTLSGNNDAPLTLTDVQDDANLITGNGTQRANVKGHATLKRILSLSAVQGSTVTLAPANEGALLGQTFQEVAGAPVQLLVNPSGNTGKVVVKASNGDNPNAAANMTSFSGGTVQLGGTLGVTRDNSLGQAWIGVLGNVSQASAPIFQMEGVNEVQFGFRDPSGVATQQPFYLLWNAVAGAGNSDLRYVTVATQKTSGSNRGLMLHHGLDQRDYSAPTFANLANPYAANVNDVFAKADTQTANTFVRLIKEGTSNLWVNGGNPNLAPNMASALPVDGLHHFGGTVVNGGTIEVLGGASAAIPDHFRGSLGKVWASFQGVGSTMANPYDPASYVGQAVAGGALYNPLFINNDAKVVLDRSQFFSDFNVAKDATFHVDDYTLMGDNYNPQIAVTLDRNDSKADGLLEGKFDLVLNSVLAASRPGNAPMSPAINNDGQAIFFINNPENKIFDKGETLVANGVLEIAGNKSIGGGKVTVGATGAADRGFTTANLATFASSKTFKLENETFTKGGLAALAVERGETLSFRNITMAGTLTINPGNILNHAVPFVAPLMPKNWSGTVEFGAASSADAVYRATGVKRNPTNVFVDRGVWQLNSFPVRTAAQVTANEDPFMNVTLVEGATLSLGKDVNDFKPYMDLTVRNDSRIRVVLRDSDIAATRGEAMAKDPVFEAREINYRAIGYGEANRDLRLAIQLDPTQLTGSTIKKGWVKLVFSPDAVDWNALHFLRENSNVQYEDYAKVRITWTTKSDIVSNAVAHLDENSYTILLEVGTDITDPVNPGAPTPTPELTTTLTPSATSVAPGADVTVTLGDWIYKGATVEVVSEDVTVTGGKVKTPLSGKTAVVTAGSAGTMTVTVTAALKSDPSVKGSATANVTVTGGGSTPSTSGGSSGCDAGFAGLGLLLAAPLFLRKRD